MSNFLSYVFTGLPADATEANRRAHSFVVYACVALMVFIVILATSPGWPLATGVVAACLCLAYIARLVLKGTAGNGT
jgi:hypothetical protein